MMLQQVRPIGSPINMQNMMSIASIQSTQNMNMNMQNIHPFSLQNSMNNTPNLTMRSSLDNSISSLNNSLALQRGLSFTSGSLNSMPSVVYPLQKANSFDSKVDRGSVV